MKQERKLSEEEKRQEGKLLSAVFEMQSKVLNFTQDSFAKDYGLGTQGHVSQYMTGKTQLGLLTAVRFSNGMLCTVRQFNPRLADELDRLGLIQRSDLRGHRIDQPTQNEQRLLAFFRALKREGKSLLLLWADSYLSTNKPKAAPKTASFLPVETMLETPLVEAPEGHETPQTVNPPTVRATSKKGSAQATSTGASGNVKAGRDKKRN